MQETQAAVVNRVKRCGVGQDGDDGFTVFGKFSRVRRYFGSFDGPGFFRRAISNRDLMAGLDQPRGNRRAHFTDAGDTQFHTALSRPLLAHTALTRVLLDHNRSTPAFRRLARKRLATA
ncbi:MAG TPA: hypothetical protein VF760_05495 [Xanthobacteraceae bacterium]